MANRDDTITDLLNLMGLCANKLPMEWERDFWLGSAFTLAELIADARGRLSEEEQGVILGTGAMLIRQAGKEQEASGMLDAFLAAWNGGAAR